MVEVIRGMNGVCGESNGGSHTKHECRRMYLNGAEGEHLMGVNTVKLNSPVPQATSPPKPPPSMLHHCYITITQIQDMN